MLFPTHLMPSSPVLQIHYCLFHFFLFLPYTFFLNSSFDNAKELSVQCSTFLITLVSLPNFLKLSP